MADAVLVGEVVATGPGDSAEVKVSRIWKGSGDATRVIHSYGATCGVTFQLGYEYLIYAFREEEGLTTGMCLAFRVDREELPARKHLDALGPGVTLVADDTLSPWAIGLIGAAAGFLLAGAVFAAISRRRAQRT